MVAEKLDRLDEAEKRLTQLIALKPDNAQALNALGYTLVDRTQRTAEGMKLIEQALALAPADPFILDSMGWAHYRMGNLDDSEKYLRRALADRSDPEIAAHLGEVLWAKGERARAREVWQSQLKQTPDNALLLETVRRFDSVATAAPMQLRRRPCSPRRRCRLRVRLGGVRGRWPPNARAGRRLWRGARVVRCGGPAVGAPWQRRIDREFPLASRRRRTTSWISRLRWARRSRVSRRASDGVELRTADGRVVTASRLGRIDGTFARWSLPVDGLAFWIQGAPRPTSPFDVETAADGTLRVLRQDGWTIVYQAFTADAAACRSPARMTLSYPDSSCASWSTAGNERAARADVASASEAQRVPARDRTASGRISHAGITVRADSARRFDRACGARRRRGRAHTRPGHRGAPTKTSRFAPRDCSSGIAASAAGSSIGIDKRLPIGGGLGGGSSDAATVLLGLNRLWRLGLSREELMQLALELGADVPFFVFGAAGFCPRHRRRTSGGDVSDDVVRGGYPGDRGVGPRRFSRRQN